MAVLHLRAPWQLLDKTCQSNGLPRARQLRTRPGRAVCLENFALCTARSCGGTSSTYRSGPLCTRHRLKLQALASVVASVVALVAAGLNEVEQQAPDILSQPMGNWHRY